MRKNAQERCELLKPRITGIIYSSLPAQTVGHEAVLCKTESDEGYTCSIPWHNHSSLVARPSASLRVPNEAGRSGNEGYNHSCTH